MAPASRAAAFLILCALYLRAQTPAQEVVIRTHSYTPPSTILHAESNLVETGLTVRDSLGRAVGGLHASDFVVRDNGVPQQITRFTHLRADSKPTAPASTQPPTHPPGTIALANGPVAETKFITFFFDDLHTGPAGLL